MTIGGWAAGLIAGVAGIALNGCASTITALQDSPTKPHTLRPGRFFTLTGERRLAFQVDRNQAKNVAWCAESLPEASQAVSSSSKPTIGLSKNSTVGTEDSYSTTLVQTFTRTEIAEVYRQMSWQACQAWAQGVYTDEQYAKKMDDIIAAGITIVETRATQPLAGTTKPEPTPTPSPHPSPKPTSSPKPKPSPSPTASPTA